MLRHHIRKIHDAEFREEEFLENFETWVGFGFRFRHLLVLPRPRRESVAIENSPNADSFFFFFFLLSILWRCCRPWKSVVRGACINYFAGANCAPLDNARKSDASTVTCRVTHQHGFARFLTRVSSIFVKVSTTIGGRGEARRGEAATMKTGGALSLARKWKTKAARQDWRFWNEFSNLRRSESAGNRSRSIFPPR